MSRFTEIEYGHIDKLFKKSPLNSQDSEIFLELLYEITDWHNDHIKLLKMSKGLDRYKVRFYAEYMSGTITKMYRGTYDLDARQIILSP